MVVQPGDVVTGVCWRKIRPMIVLEVDGKVVTLAPCTTSPKKQHRKKGWMIRLSKKWFEIFKNKQNGHVDLRHAISGYKIEDLRAHVGRVKAGPFVTLLMIFSYFRRKRNGSS